jgi:UDP-N-acetylmuramate dehydrogenase
VLNFQNNELLSSHSTLGIGGPARFFVEVTDQTSLKEAISWAKKDRLPFFILGGGSNILVSDNGFNGLVIKNCLRGIEQREAGDRQEFRVGAGENWDDFVLHCVKNDLTGVECLSGIPGFVGATPIQNVGAYGQDVSETISVVEAFDTQTDSMVRIENSECGFGYRTSRFKTTDKDRFVITHVSFLLYRDKKPSIRYSELQKRLEEKGDLSLQTVRSTVLEIRKSKGMVIDESDPDSRSAGSFFMNPIISQSQLDHIKGVMGAVDLPPAFEQTSGMYKISAAWLIERAGLHKGYRHGSVGISSKHTLAIINRGQGTAEQVLELKELIEARVLEKFGVKLVPEPNFIGF